MWLPEATSSPDLQFIVTGILNLELIQRIAEQLKSTTKARKGENTR